MEKTDEQLLAQQKKVLEQMAEERRQLFQDLGVSESELLEALKDKRRFSPKTWELLQKRRKALEETIDKNIQAAGEPKNAQKPSSPPQISGHWIHVK